MPQKNCSAAYARGEMRGSGIRFFPPGTFYQEVFTKPPCVCVCVGLVCVCHGTKFKKYFNSTFLNSLEKDIKDLNFELKF